MSLLLFIWGIFSRCRDKKVSSLPRILKLPAFIPPLAPLCLYTYRVIALSYGCVVGEANLKEFQYQVNTVPPASHYQNL